MDEQQRIQRRMECLSLAAKMSDFSSGDIVIIAERLWGWLIEASNPPVPMSNTEYDDIPF